MSTTHTPKGSEASQTAHHESDVRRVSRRNTVPERSTSRASEDQQLISALGLPQLERRKKGPLNVSEASIPAPKSSDVSAQGQVFVPTHEHPRENNGDVLHNHSGESPERATETIRIPEPSTEQDQPKDTQASPNPTPASALAEAELPADSPEDLEATASSSRPSAHLFTQSESAVAVLGESFAKFGSPQRHSVPSIRIHRPSGTAMAASVGTTAMNSANVPATPVQSALEQSPAAAGNAPLGALSTHAAALQAPANLTSNLSSVTNAVSAATSAISLPLPGLPVEGKVGKKKKIVRKARKVVLRKRVLALIIGRDLAKVVHPQLNAVTNLAGGLPLPLDGASDLFTGYARRSERKKDQNRKDLDQKIAAARIRAEAEDIHRCRICQGLTRTTLLRKYHRLKLKRDRTDMSAIDRRADSQARVAAYRCKCTRRLLGVANERAVQDSVPAQHLRAPAAIEAPLSGVDGTQQQ